MFLLDETNVNHTLVKDGWWWYRKYAPGDTVLEGLEEEAREAKKGLWADLYLPAHSVQKPLSWPRTEKSIFQRF